MLHTKPPLDCRLTLPAAPCREPSSFPGGGGFGRTCLAATLNGLCRTGRIGALRPILRASSSSGSRRSTFVSKCACFGRLIVRQSLAPVLGS